MKINDLVKGNKKFREVSFPRFEGNLKELVENGQRPDVLFVGCSDSRVTPDLMLDTEPGDMFILRNVGNFVPPYTPDEDYHGSSAAIEYAVSVLGVRHIIICGHSHCGACKSLYHDVGDSPDLITFPDVERKIKSGELQIHGWYYRIEDGTIEYYDGEECSFMPLTEDINEK